MEKPSSPWIANPLRHFYLAQFNIGYAYQYFKTVASKKHGRRAKSVESMLIKVTGGKKWLDLNEYFGERHL